MTTDKRLQTAARQAVARRNYRRARDRALARLANIYPNHYKQLLEEEKENDKTLGKQWLYLDGTTIASLDGGDNVHASTTQIRSHHNQNTTREQEESDTK